MGKLINGVWQDIAYNTAESQGRFVRDEARFRHWITADGSAGPSGDAGFKAEPGRYHLYVSLACPWAHRTLIMRELKGLTRMIDVSVVHYLMLENGWEFRDAPGTTGDQLFNSDYLHQIYTRAKADITGRVTVPVLWDKQRETIVSNESSEIIRMMNKAFDGLGAEAKDYYPRNLKKEIDTINERVYATINNGVYRCGFATMQEAYQEAFSELFESLEWLEEILAKHRYLVGDQLTEADIRLFTTLIRFDSVYHGHFKTNKKRIVDYPNLHAYTKDIYQQPKIAQTVNFEHIKRHYYMSHTSINPTQIVPSGPDLDLNTPHNRG